MAAQKWLNWAPDSKKVLPGRENSTDKTDKKAVLSVLSVPSKPEGETFEASQPVEIVEMPVRGRRLAIDAPHDQVTKNAVREIASILAAASLRYDDLQRNLVGSGASGIESQLAICETPSVHEL